MMEAEHFFEMTYNSVGLYGGTPQQFVYLTQDDKTQWRVLGWEPACGESNNKELVRSITSRKGSLFLHWTHLAPMFKAIFYMTATEF